MRRPDKYNQVFEILGEYDVIPKDFVPIMVDLGKIHNVLVHVYLEVKPEKIYDKLQTELVNLEKFARCIVEFLEKQ